MSKSVTGSIFIIDNDPDFGLSTQWLLESSNYPAFFYSDARTFLDNYKGDMGCIVLDMNLPSMNGIQFMDTLEERNISIPVIMISERGTIPQAVAAIKKGALDFIEKPIDQNTLLSVVENGLRVATERFHILNKTAVTRGNYELLSKREKQVMALVIKGYANREIAEFLGISPKTVEVHRSRVMSKMQADSLPALVNFGLEVPKVLDSIVTLES